MTIGPLFLLRQEMCQCPPEDVLLFECTNVDSVFRQNPPIIDESRKYLRTAAASETVPRSQDVFILTWWKDHSSDATLNWVGITHGTEMWLCAYSAEGLLPHMRKTHVGLTTAASLGVSDSLLT